MLQDFLTRAGLGVRGLSMLQPCSAVPGFRANTLQPGHQRGSTQDPPARCLRWGALLSWPGCQGSKDSAQRHCRRRLQVHKFRTSRPGLSRQSQVAVAARAPKFFVPVEGLLNFLPITIDRLRAAGLLSGSAAAGFSHQQSCCELQSDLGMAGNLAIACSLRRSKASYALRKRGFVALASVLV